MMRHGNIRQLFIDSFVYIGSFIAYIDLYSYLPLSYCNTLRSPVLSYKMKMVVDIYFVFIIFSSGIKIVVGTYLAIIISSYETKMVVGLFTRKQAAIANQIHTFPAPASDISKRLISSKAIAVLSRPPTPVCSYILANLGTCSCSDDNLLAVA